MQYSMGLVLALLLGLMGCSETLGAGGNVDCVGHVCPCTEAGIRTAIAEGGGPFTFDCGPTTVVTRAELVIDNDVVLDGEGKLTVDGNDDHRVFRVARGVTAELRGFTVIRGNADGASVSFGGGIRNEGDLSLTNSTISDNTANFGGGGIRNDGRMTVTDSTVSRNNAVWGGGVSNQLDLILRNSTVSGNWAIDGAGLGNGGRLTLQNSTVSRNLPRQGVARTSQIIMSDGRLTVIGSTVFAPLAAGSAIYFVEPENDSYEVEIAFSLIAGPCEFDPNASSSAGGAGGVGGSILLTTAGYNIETPGDTCRFDQQTDLPRAPHADVRLESLGMYGGPTETHALGAGSVAIDMIPEADCVDAEDARLATDQRGEPRDSMCDVGAFEVQP